MCGVPLTRPRIILDTDPGGDDTFAFLWLLSLMQQRCVDLVAITTTAGNVPADRTFTNASQLLNLVGLPQIEVGRGVPFPDADRQDASHIHGSDGMGNLTQTLPPATHNWEMARSSDDLIIDRLNAAPGELTLVAIGPLTNLAAAETRHPGILQKAKALVIMAGAFNCSGNVTPHAEFNVWFNPTAAATVLGSRSDTVIIPLDVTRQLIFTREMAQRVGQRNPNHPIAQLLQNLCQFMTGTALYYRETEGVSGFLVHDAATIAALFYPETLWFQQALVRVETQGQWTIGQTGCDRRPLAKPETNAWVALQVDAAGLLTRLVEDLQGLLIDGDVTGLGHQG